MIKHLSYTLSLLLMVFSLSAQALTLDQAKASGLVGEQTNGYLGVIRDSPEVRDLVSEINRKRRAAYQNKARQAGVSVPLMEQRVGQRLLQRLAPGEYYRDPNGQWRRK